MTGRIVLYGATGYTGGLIARQAKEQGIDLLISGRSPDKLAVLGEQTGFDSKTADLQEEDALDELLKDAACVIHAAGPFSQTSAPMLAACLRNKVHYIDITGEIEVFEFCAGHHAQAQDAGIMLLPGAGFDVMPSDCLAAYVASRLGDGMRLTIGVSLLDAAGKANMSRGTAKTAAESVGLGTAVRRGGRITYLKKLPSREIDFGRGSRSCIGLSWGDVSTAYYSTSIPDIEVYFEADRDLRQIGRIGGALGGLLRTSLGQRFLQTLIDKRPDGPSEDQRTEGRARLWVEIMDGRRHRAISLLETPEPYQLTSLSTLAIARKVSAGELRPGFCTPSQAYGADFVLSFPDVTREDVDV